MKGQKEDMQILLDNDMRPHKMFIQATLPFFFDNEKRKTRDSIIESGYSDDIVLHPVGYVQTLQYFEDNHPLQLGDPCGHRQAMTYDALQFGMNGYEMTAFSGTNTMFRRQALDSVGGLQCGSLTKDTYTELMIVNCG